MKKLRLGIIGAGKTAGWHLKAYKKLPCVEVAAIANPNSERGKKLARKHKIQNHFTDGFELIDRSNIDAIDISVPTLLHKDFILRAISKGLHIYTEKPVCATEEGFKEILDANKSADRIIFNGFNYRFLPEFRKIRSILKSGRLGRVRYARMFRTTSEMPGSYIFTGQGSGIFNEFQCHFVDLLYYFGFGEPEKVFASGTTAGEMEINPDTATTTLLYPDKTIAEITTSFASPGIAPELMIVGSKAALNLRFGCVSMTQNDFRTLPELILLMFRDSMTLPFRILKNPFQGSCKHFINCVLNNRQSESDVLSALKTFRITSAAELSYQKGSPVVLS